MKLSIGDHAPEFTLPDQTGVLRTVSSQKGKWVLLYFYPKDDTPGCTQEACSFRDQFPAFDQLKLTVFGVSVDSVKSHLKFVQKYKLPFLLLSDEDKTVVEAYGVWGKKKFMGKEYMGISRTSFLIDPEGKIAKIYQDVKPVVHVQEVLADLKSLVSLG